MNFDMQEDFKNEWPAERLALRDARWRHNDFKIIAYPFTYKLYDDFVAKGDLKQ